MVGWREEWMERRDRKMLDTPKGISVRSYGGEETKKTSRAGGMVAQGEEGFELELVGFTVKCSVIADCSQCPSVYLSVISVSPLSLSLFISHSVPDPMFSSPALSLFP